jgi:hypothetical protein
METEAEYYARRAAEERKAAEAARSPEAEQRHRALAERYALLVQDNASAQPITNGAAV